MQSRKSLAVRHAVLGAVTSAIAGFSLAAATLAVNLEPAYWVPRVDRSTQASVTVVDKADLASRDSRTGVQPRIMKVFAVAAPLGATRSPTTAAPTTLVPPNIPSELGIPGIVLQAYKQAQERLAGSDPTCRIDWQTLAGVGKIESGHARNGRVGADGTTFEPILGPPLTGGPYASIPDTDDGVLDGDPVWDRAVGPMQFIPGTWRYVGVDGNDDGVASPHNIFDAALSAGVYLCAGSRDLSVRASLDAALHTYNNSDSYVALVLAWIDGYRAGKITPLPPVQPPPPGPSDSPTTPPTSDPTTDPPTTGPPTTGPPTTGPPTTGPPTTGPPTTGSPTTGPPTTDPTFDPTVEPTPTDSETATETPPPSETTPPAPTGTGPTGTGPTGTGPTGTGPTGTGPTGTGSATAPTGGTSTSPQGTGTR